MKKNIMKALSVMLAVVLTLTAAPLSGFVGIEIPEWLDTSTEAKATDSSAIDGAVEFNGNYYKLFDLSMNWNEAKQYCESLGGHLVVITSKEENDFLTQISTSAFMIGLSDATLEGTWKWVTDEPFSYNNWRKGEPNNQANEDYVLMNGADGSWNDGHLEREDWPFICEWEEDFFSETYITKAFLRGSSHSFPLGEKIIIAVSEDLGDEYSSPESISVTIADNGIVSVSDIGDTPDTFLELPEQLKKSKTIILDTHSVGQTAVSITNTERNEVINLLISVYDDEWKDWRIDDVPEILYAPKVFGVEVEHDYYNYLLNGIYIADFSAEKVSGGYNYKFNAYNEKYCLGIVEVIDSKGNLIETKKIDKFNNQVGTSIKNTAAAGWYLVEDFVKWDVLSFRSQQTSTWTPIEVFVPYGGMIRVTNDSVVSTTCFVVNLFDALFTAGDVIEGSSSLKLEQIDVLDKAVLERFVASEYYLKFAEKYQNNLTEDLNDKSIEYVFESFIPKIGVMASDLLDDLDVDLKDLISTADSTAVGIAEDIFKKVTGPAGQVLNYLFYAKKACNYLMQMSDFYYTSNKRMGCYIVAPEEGADTLSTVDGIKVKTNDNVPANTILRTIKVLNSDIISIEEETGRIISEHVTYDISLYSNDNEIQPNGIVEVVVPIPNRFSDDITILKETEDGGWQIINATVKNGYAYFEVDHFCLFAIVEHNEPDCIIGDVNEDGKVNTLDRVALTRYIAKWEEYPEGSINMTAADVNGDGKVNTLDRVILTRYIAKWTGYETLPYTS